PLSTKSYAYARTRVVGAKCGERECHQGGLDRQRFKTAETHRAATVTGSRRNREKGNLSTVDSDEGPKLTPDNTLVPYSDKRGFTNTCDVIIDWVGGATTPALAGICGKTQRAAWPA